MILFHGSNVVVKEPRLIAHNRLLDFGDGFYTTINKEQAINFAQKVKRNKGGKAILNVYELNEQNLKGLKVKEFDGPNDKWLDFISANRNGTYKGEKYDVIIGPVADDDVYQTLQVYASGILTKEQALEALKIKKLYNQFVFASNDALKAIKFLKMEEH